MVKRYIWIYPDNWDQLFHNLESGKLGINEMVFAVQALTKAFSLYDQFATASEKQEATTV